MNMRSLGMFGAGFGAGLLFLPLIVVIVTAFVWEERMQEQAAQASEMPGTPDPRADFSQDCPDIDPRHLLGEFEGEKVFEDGRRQRWTVKHEANGQYQIRFVVTEGEVTEASTESGLWSYFRCLYTVVVRQLDDKPAHFRDVYHVHRADENQLEYSHYASGERFRVDRVGSQSE